MTMWITNSHQDIAFLHVNSGARFHCLPEQTAKCFSLATHSTVASYLDFAFHSHPIAASKVACNSTLDS